MRTQRRPRLQDDPALRESFAELDELLDGYDLERIRPRPVPPPPPKPAHRAAACLGAGGATAAVAILLWWWWPAASPPGVVEGARTAPAPVAARVVEPVVIEEVVPPPSAAAEVAPAPPARAPTLPEPAAEEPTSPGIEEPTLQVTEPPPIEPPPPPNLLEEELRLLRMAEDALARGEPREVLEVADAYVTAFPEGRLTSDVDLLRLRAHVALEEWAEAERVAARLEQVPGNPTRLLEIRTTRADALVALGRCAEALAVADGLPKKQASEVRKTCR